MPRSTTPKSSYWKPVGVLLIVLLTTALTASPPVPSTSADVVPVVAAASGSLTSGAPGPSAVFPITVTGVQKLGAASVLVGYDPAILKPVACQRGPAFDVGVCNRSYDRNEDGTADAVLFTVLSLNGVSTTGMVVPLANITWQAVVPVQGQTTTALTVEVRTFTDTDGSPLTYTTQDGKITLLSPLPPTLTPTSTATATATLTPTATAHERRSYLPLIVRTP
jgi:hypothetical protein